jgi:hypothetical protein
MIKKNTENFKNYEIISSSELGQFNYCSIAWYLQKSGYEPKSPKLKIGKSRHIKIGNIIDNTQRKNKRIKVLALIGYMILFLGILIFILGVFL